MSAAFAPEFRSQITFTAYAQTFVLHDKLKFSIYNMTKYQVAMPVKSNAKQSRKGRR